MSLHTRAAGAVGAALAVAAMLAGCGQESPDAAGDQLASPAASPPASSSAPPSEPPSNEPTSKPAAAPVPQELKFSGTTLDGKPFSGASLAGKPAVLWFWAEWCPNCRAEAPTLSAAEAAHGDQVTFLGIASDSGLEGMRNFVREYGVGGFEHLNDGSGEIWQHFGVTYQPAYAFVSPDGSVDVVTDQLSEDEFNGRVRQLRGE